LAPLITAAYYFLSVGLLYLLNLGVPAWIEQAISIFAAPAAFSLLVWNPVLKDLGLASGEWIVAPSFPAFLFIVSAYSLLVFFVSWCCCRLFRRFQTR
jgi:hypothetical protein